MGWQRWAGTCKVERKGRTVIKKTSHRKVSSFQSAHLRMITSTIIPSSLHHIITHITHPKRLSWRDESLQGWSVVNKCLRMCTTNVAAKEWAKASTRTPAHTHHHHHITRRLLRQQRRVTEEALTSPPSRFCWHSIYRTRWSFCKDRYSLLYYWTVYCYFCCRNGRGAPIFLTVIAQHLKSITVWHWLITIPILIITQCHQVAKKEGHHQQDFERSVSQRNKTQHQRKIYY